MPELVELAVEDEVPDCVRGGVLERDVEGVLVEGAVPAGLRVEVALKVAVMVCVGAMDVLQVDVALEVAVMDCEVEALGEPLGVSVMAADSERVVEAVSMALMDTVGVCVCVGDRVGVGVPVGEVDREALMEGLAAIVAVALDVVVMDGVTDKDGVLPGVGRRHGQNRRSSPLGCTEQLPSVLE